VEENETPEECIVREMKEEIELELEIEELKQFSIVAFEDRDEYTYWQKANLDIGKIQLHEGQRLRWFCLDEVREIPLAYGFNKIVEMFYEKKPFRKGN